LKLFYLTNFAEENTYWKTLQESKIKSAGSASQNFERLLIEGFSKQELDLTVCSFRDVLSYPGHKRIFWAGYKEILYNNVLCIYLPFINLPVIKQICFSITLIPEVIKWTINNHDKQKGILFTCINIPMVVPVLLLRLIFKNPVFVIVPDLPSLVLKYTKLNRIQRLLKYPFEWLAKAAEHRFDGYVLLTEPMNKVVNRRNKPYIVVEGIADTQNILNHNKNDLERTKKGIMYAGALYKEFGIDILIRGFMRTNNDNIELWLFGAGDMEKEIAQNILIDSRIKYYGMRPRGEVIKYEQRAILLVNPRPSLSPFTEYSFPSKTTEYMASGTPLLTTRLPGIPKEYFDYVFVLKNETIEGMRNKIESILEMPRKKLDEQGQRARRFVLENKNSLVQTKKIIDMIEDNI